MNEKESIRTQNARRAPASRVWKGQAQKGHAWRRRARATPRGTQVTSTMMPAASLRPASGRCRRRECCWHSCPAAPTPTRSAAAVCIQHPRGPQTPGSPAAWSPAPEHRRCATWPATRRQRHPQRQSPPTAKKIDAADLELEGRRPF